jgi:LuxR family maltose regulon positive regulatory protein
MDSEALALGGGMAGTLQAGYDALARGAWEEARDAFQAELGHGEAAAALEGLGMAAWWLDDSETTFDARERAYLLYRESGERARAARVATWLAWDHVAFRGETAVASGWLQRAHRLLEGLESAPEYGWLLVQEGELALLYQNDSEKARSHGRSAAELGRSLEQLDLEMVGLALEGLALVTEGHVPEGMQQLDEATAAAVAGEFRDLNAIGATCCYVIYACERVQDYGRATQWCARVTEFCKRWRIRSLFAVCRTHLANVLVWRGSWEEAEDMLLEATSELSVTRPARSFEGLMRLGELRRRQGRWEEAEALFQDHAFHPFAQLGSAALELDRGNTVPALGLVQRFLRNLASEDRTSRAIALEVLARAQLALGDVEHAAITVQELSEIADLIDTLPLLAAARLAQGLLCSARSEHESALELLEDSVDLFTRSGAPFEGGRARLELARALVRLDRRAEAVREARAARDAFRKLGARHEADSATDLLAELTSDDSGHPRNLLSRREQEVLALVADGLSNRDIAARLSLSAHTVHRHVANIFNKLGISSRAAAVAFAHTHDLL